MNIGERKAEMRERESEKEHGRCLILSMFLLSVHCRIFVHHHNSEAMEDGLTVNYCKIAACNVLELLFC